MLKFAKIAAVPVLAFAASLPLAAPAAADTNDDRILVTEMDSWKANATRRLNRALQRNPINQTGAPAPGIVQLSFTLNANGSPTNVEVLSNSANRPAAQSAKYAVRRMGDLSDVPVANAGDTQFIANVIFANDHREKRELIAELKSKPYASFASKSGKPTYVVLSN
ncbi:MAG: energy transducer TonB [Pseudomonadota bacterium]